MIIGNITPSVVEFPLVGRPGVILQLLNSSRVPVNITNAVTIVADIFRNIGDVALISKASASAQILVLEGYGYIYIPLDSTDVAKLSPQWLYDIIVKLLNSDDNTIIEQVNAFKLLPVNTPQLWTKPTEIFMALSTIFINTLSLLGETGGTGYLNGVATVNQTIGCVVQFRIAGEQPQQWQLMSGTNAAEPGEICRPIDYNATTNAKYWQKIL